MADEQGPKYIFYRKNNLCGKRVFVSINGIRKAGTVIGRIKHTIEEGTDIIDETEQNNYNVIPDFAYNQSVVDGEIIVSPAEVLAGISAYKNFFDPADLPVVHDNIILRIPILRDGQQLFRYRHGDDFYANISPWFRIYHHYMHEVISINGDVYQTRDLFDVTQPILRHTFDRETYRLGMWYMPMYPTAITQAHITDLRVIYQNRIPDGINQYSLELLPAPTTSVVACIHFQDA